MEHQLCTQARAADDVGEKEPLKMWCWRKVLKIIQTEHVSNDEVLQKVNEQRSITE